MPDRQYTNFELFEPRLKNLPEDMLQNLAPAIKTGFDAAEQIQKMHNHWAYRTGAYLSERLGISPPHIAGEVLFEAAMYTVRKWKRFLEH